MTLRELTWMAMSRLRTEWAQSAVIAAAAAAAFGGKFDPVKFIPPAFRDKPRKLRVLTPEEQKAESDRAFRLLGRMLSGKRK